MAKTDNFRSASLRAPRTSAARGTRCLAGAMLLLAGPALLQAQSVPPPPSALEPPPPVYPGDMPADVRESLSRIVVVSGRGPAGQEVGGTYERATAGLVGGMAEGNRRARISKQVGPVPIDIPIPILTLPATIIGGLAGSMQRQIQEFRDELAEELINAENQPLTDDGLALDVFWGVRRLPALNSKLLKPDAELPEETDAVLYVSFGDIGIDVQAKEAIITTSAEATLRTADTGTVLYTSTFHYQDRDTLQNWTANDNMLWRAYANFARYYLSREITAAVFDRAQLASQIVPVATKTTKRDRKNTLQLNTKSVTPSLAWQLSLPDTEARPAWAANLDESAIYYDLEILDAQRPVYTAEQIAGSQHTLAYEIEPCKTYRWSVRPSYHVDGKVLYGGWMAFPIAPAGDAETPAINGPAGRSASTAPAYSQDFARLEVACGKR